MSKLKGTKEINKILNKFLEPFDCIADIGPDFCYWSGSSRIDYTLVVSENQDKWFKEFAHSLMPELNCDIFLLSLMHELGHHETIDDIEDDEELWRACWEVKKELNSKEERTKEDNFTYFNLPDEKMATEWGLHYMKTHPAEISELWNQLQPAILKCYQLNDIH